MDSDAVFASLGLDAAALSGGTLSVVSPIDGAELARVREHGPGDVDAAIGKALTAFAAWRTVPGPRRGLRRRRHPVPMVECTCTTPTAAP